MAETTGVVKFYSIGDEFGEFLKLSHLTRSRSTESGGRPLNTTSKRRNSRTKCIILASPRSRKSRMFTRNDACRYEDGYVTASEAETSTIYGDWESVNLSE